MQGDFKVALLFSGQVRNIVDIDFFRNGLNLFMKNINYSIYAHTWNEMGKSLSHNPNNKDYFSNLDSESYLDDLFYGMPIKSIKRDKFRDFESLISPEHFKIHKSNKFSSLTKNSLPQIYSFYKSFHLFKEKLINYDLILRVRFDSIFTQNLKEIINTKNIINANLFHQNFGRSYYPDRIYDIFFGGSYFVMNKLSNVWDDIPYLINDNFNNGLDKRDACRLFYLEAKNNLLNIKSIKSRICDIYRGDKKNYAKLIIYSGLTKRTNLFKIVPTINYFNKWFSLNCKLPENLVRLYMIIEILRLVGIDIFLIRSLINKFLIKFRRTFIIK